jgi:hypothetical protein
MVDRSVRIDQEVEARLLPYLQACPVFLAWMEYTRDLIGDRFGVEGGSAIASDGVYYWRLDAVDYIREYDIAVPDEVVAHCESRDWRPPEFSRPEYLAIYQRLEQMLVPEF